MKVNEPIFVVVLTVHDCYIDLTKFPQLKLYFHGFSTEEKNSYVRFPVNILTDAQQTSFE